MRLNKPIGSLLLLWPTLWALWIAARGFPPTSILLLFIAGVVVMRSAGCVINDIADRKLDAGVMRTQNRPLVVGSVSTKQASVLFLGLCLIGLILVLQLNRLTIALSVIGLLLASIYPFTKRVTHLPQVVLGIAFAWSVPMAFVAINQTIPLTGWLLFLIAAAWPVAYDTIYALMDKDDDLKVGIKSTAILFGGRAITFIMAIQLSVISGLVLVGFLLELTRWYYLSLLIALLVLGYQWWLVQQQTTQHYFRAFKNNQWLGLIIFIGIILGVTN